MSGSRLSSGPDVVGPKDSHVANNHESSLPGMQELQKKLRKVVSEEFGEEVTLELTRPDEKFGDYSTNVAMQLGNKLGKNPREIAILLAGKLHDLDEVDKVEIAGPGFINIRLTDGVVLAAATLATNLSKPLVGQEILVEFGDPNPFKRMHIGHLYSYTAGESIARLLEAAGAKVVRLSYHGDVGLHVAKAVWGMVQAGVDPSKMPKSPTPDIGLYYQKGAISYDEDESAKQEIDKVNDHIYKRDDPVVNDLYDWGKKNSFDEFAKILDDLSVRIDQQYMESASAQKGLELVKANIDKVFASSQGAVVYEGEKAGLHTRVFLTSSGLPTYEAKDLGLAELKGADYPKAAHSIIITAGEQAEYFKVMLAALSEINPALAGITRHLFHGFVNLSTGKMSSRKGEVYTAIKLMEAVSDEVKSVFGSENPAIEIAAIKYEFLKHRLGSDIVYDPKESVSLAGDSGPYLQYAHARALSVLRKAPRVSKTTTDKSDPDERSLARKISIYPEVVAEAAKEYLPSHIASYLYGLTQSFNSFYEKNRIIGHERQALRLELTKNYATVLKAGLNLLGITAPEKV
ncbi:arginine--tRNA ligase [Candidatus Saccharibacteria bacterium RIFCSPHIGHO2_01_FULL_48_12]|nr:MAG: arginine--tRNA ligase [Candidatus Saccharibacteria bacterium RIFCSPHIGHO2_01_FULL_48_12]